MRRLTIQIAGVCALAALVVGGIILLTNPVSASFPASIAGPPALGPGVNDDGFEKLPLARQAHSYSSLIMQGLVHPDMNRGVPSGPSAPPLQAVPHLNIVWG